MAKIIQDLEEILWLVLLSNGLAMAESERYLPSLITKIEDLLDESGLKGNNDSYDRLSQWMCETSASRNSLYR